MCCNAWKQVWAAWQQDSGWQRIDSLAFFASNAAIHVWGVVTKIGQRAATAARADNDSRWKPPEHQIAVINVQVADVEVVTGFEWIFTRRIKVQLGSNHSCDTALISPCLPKSTLLVAVLWWRSCKGGVWMSDSVHGVCSMYTFLWGCLRASWTPYRGGVLEGCKDYINHWRIVGLCPLQWMKFDLFNLSQCIPFGTRTNIAWIKMSEVRWPVETSGIEIVKEQPTAMPAATWAWWRSTAFWRFDSILWFICCLVLVAAGSVGSFADNWSIVVRAFSPNLKIHQMAISPSCNSFKRSTGPTSKFFSANGQSFHFLNHAYILCPLLWWMNVCVRKPWKPKCILKKQDCTALVRKEVVEAAELIGLRTATSGDLGRILL